MAVFVGFTILSRTVFSISDEVALAAISVENSAEFLKL